MGGMELDYVEQAFRDNYIVPLGPNVEAFEHEFEQMLGGGHCTAMVSGTAALHVSLRIHGISPGDEVVSSDLTFVASTAPILYQGATPVFVDAEPRTWNMDLDLLEEFLTSRRRSNSLPKAVVLVHLYGQPADLDRAAELCEEHGVALVEDAAESLGSEHRGRPTGTFGRMGIFSFNGNKIITTGGGGMLWSPDSATAQRAGFLITQARDEAPHYQHSEVGYNYRMSNVLAGIGLGQLKVLSERVEQKRAIFEGYRERLAKTEKIAFMPEAPGGRANRWLSCVLFGDEAEEGFALREAVRLALASEDIEARPIWKPMHLQPLYSGAECVGGGVGEDLFARGLCLPSGTALSSSDLDRICEIILRTVDRGTR
jgi:pyridoxal phosphate-dependent aminotransferase EpsN